MVAPKRITRTYPDRWKLTTTYLANIPEHHQRIAETMINYMNNHDHHEIWDLENEVMNKFEDEKTMCRLEIGIHFKWRVLAKQHVFPYAERYCFAIYSCNSLLIAVFESPEFGGMVVQKGNYTP